MRILVTGGDGQVGRALSRRGAWARPRQALDITREAEVAAALDGIDAVINAAAYTAVDRAESEPERAFAVNEGGAQVVARACAQRGLPLVHLSTDYVFDGAKPTPYVEDDAVAPLGVYGKSKAAGEAAVRAAHDRAVILRTSWVFGADGSNFVRTILRLARERESLSVVDDQHGCPTWADDIAAAALLLLERGAAGTLHFCGAPETTWHGFATEIVDGARARGAALKARTIAAIPTSAYPTAARRPASSRLDCGRIGGFGITPPPWGIGLGAVLDVLVG